jgi:hypothetical protein
MKNRFKTITTIIGIILLITIGIVWAMHCPDAAREKAGAFTVMTYNVVDIGRNFKAC